MIEKSKGVRHNLLFLHGEWQGKTHSMSHNLL